MGYDAKRVGARLRGMIAERGYTVTDFATRLGISRQALYSWLNGDIRIKLSEAATMCDMLECSLDELALREE